MGCNSLIRAFIFRILNYVSAPKPCNSVGFIFPHLYIPHLISAPYKLLVIRRVWQDKIEHSPLISKIKYLKSTHSLHTRTP